MGKCAKTLLLVAILCLSACSPAPTPTPIPTATATFTPQPTDTPTVTPLPSRYPTSTTPAPEEAFTEVGSIADFSGESTSGRAVVAGLQTIVIREFVFDGQCTKADIRLGKEGQFDQPAGILTTLEARPYNKETLVLTIPLEVTPDKADSIAVYCVETGEVLGWGRFD